MKYKVELTTTASVVMIIEADDEIEAYEKAGAEVPQICAQCAGWGRGYSLDLGDDWQDGDIWAAGDSDD